MEIILIGVIIIEYVLIGIISERYYGGYYETLG